MAKKGTTKYQSNLQEKRVSAELKGKTVIASGSLWGSKGDVRNDELLVECKTTQKPYYSLSMKTWDKIRTEAIKDGLRIPVMCIDLPGSICLAVFEKSSFIEEFAQYETFCTWDITRHTILNTQSTRLYGRVEEVVFLVREPPLHLCVIPWGDFLNLLKGENNDK